MNVSVTEPVASQSEAEPSLSSSPYIGLSYYTEENSHLFFGRDAERTLIIGNLRAARLTILYAASGVGKSSLLRAGVAARLWELAGRSLTERGSARFIPVVFNSWRDEPVEDLIDEIQRAVAPFFTQPDLELPRTGLDQAISAAAAATGATLLVVLDQFEEYFLYGARESQQGRFADELAGAINRADLAANFLISVREDAYAGVGDLLRGKVANPYGNTLSLSHLGRSCAREAITRPIEQINSSHPEAVQIQIEPELVDAVLDQVRTGEVAFDHQGQGTITGPGGTANGEDKIETPYLQLVMSALWESERRAGSTVLRLSTLKDLGGAEAIVRSHLEQALSGLSEPERETAVDVFDHLVTPSGTKIVHTVDDLADYSRRQPADVQALVDKLTSGQQRILRPVPPAPGDDKPRVEIFHDVLAPAILAWRTAQSADRLEHQRQAAEDRANRERRRARTFRALAAVSSLMLVVAVVGAVLALVETHRAQSARRQALSGELALQADSDLHYHNVAPGVLLSIEAYRYDHTAAAKDSLFQAELATGSMVAYLGGHAGASVASVAYSHGGLIASGDANGVVLLQDATTGKVMHRLKGTRVAFSPDGRLLATGDAHGDLWLWSTASDHPLWVISHGTGGGVNAVAFSHNGQLLAAANQDGTVGLFNPANGQHLRTLLVGPRPVNTVAFSPDGRTLATGAADGAVVQWSTSSWRSVRTFRADGKSINSVAFSPRGDKLAAASDDHNVIVWSTASGRLLLTLRAHHKPVYGVAFSPDGRTLASGGADDEVTLWSADTGREMQVLRAYRGPVRAVAFSPSGATLASGGDDGQVVVWLATPSLLEHVLLPQSPALAVAYNRSGDLLASAQSNGTVDLWDPAGHVVKVLRGYGGHVNSVAFSPAGAVVAAGGSTGNVMLWNPSTGAQERTLPTNGGVVNRVAFSPDGRTLAAATARGNVILWNARTWAREPSLPGHAPVPDIAFSPNSKTLASAAGQDVTLWYLASRQRPKTITGHTSFVDSVAFSSDGRRLASGDVDGQIIVSNVRTGRQIGPTLNAHSRVLSLAFSRRGNFLASGERGVALWDLRSGMGYLLPGHGSGFVRGVAFVPASRSLASAGDDKTVQVTGPLPLALTPGAVVAQLCGVVRQNLPPSEWNQFLPGEQYQKTC
jgi:WD40 repeat protein